ncbi:hypothetical protein BHQ19_25025 [Mycolicibacterium porcinum]|nr:hypothetical protein BHQ19_25025 [Mycolicibacterium porcinum]
MTFTSLQVRVLLSMLTEADSPLSANLRATVAEILGAAGIVGAAAQLREIALDEAEGLQTRLNAAKSFIRLGGRIRSADVTRLLESDSPVLRAAVCVAALESDNDRLFALAQSWFHKVGDDEVRRYVQHRVPRLRDTQKTADDA